MPPLCKEDRRAILALARQVIVETAVHQRIPELPPFTGALSERGSAFVTVRCSGRLRGCVGRVDRDLALGEAVAQSAIGAVMRDPRFPPVAAREIANLEIEVSVLSEFRRVAPQGVDAGAYGFLVTRGSQRGLLLPQVAAEHHWSAERLLEETCRKAGLESGAWRDSGVQVFGFTAEVFSDAGAP